MKTLILLLILACYNFISNCQSIAFYYDANGNRIQRNEIYLKSSKINNNDSTTNAPANNKKIENPLDNEGYDLPEEEYKDILNGEEISIYPNPNKGSLIIKIPPNSVTAGASIAIYDLNGKIVYNRQNLSGVNYIGLNDIPSGTYLLKLRSGSDTSEWKIIKE